MAGERAELAIRRQLGAPGISVREELSLRRQLAGGNETGGPITATLAGINRGLLNVVGAPVDIMSAGLGLIGLGSERPIGGSQQLGEDVARTTGLGFEKIEDFPQSMRPFVRGGQTIGESIPFAAAPLAAVRAGLKGPQMLQPIMEMARTSPGTFALLEAAGAEGAGIGRGIAEALAPGDELIGMGAEIGGGVAGAFLAPTSLILRAVDATKPILNRIRSIFSQTGREIAVGQKVRGRLTEAGEDVNAVVRQLEDPEAIAGERFTAGQKADSPVLLALEKKLLRDIPDMDASVRQRVEDTILAFNRAFDLAVEGGDATLIKSISEERQRFFTSLMGAKVEAATQRAAMAVERTAPRRGRPSLSRTVRTTLESALSDARAGERALWKSIPRDIPSEPSNLNDAFLAVRSELLEEEALPAPIEAFMRRVQRVLNPEEITKDAEGAAEEIIEEITSGDLLRFRSRVLEMQRQARSGATPDFGLARRLGQLADGALDDLADIPGTDEARAFSRSLNQIFTRGEVGSLLGFSPRGGARIEPELTLQEGIGGGGQGAAVASRQIEEAAQLQGLPEGVTRRTTMSEQEDFVRNIFVKAVDPTTGKVNSNRLARLMRDNEELLGRFPGLRNNLLEAGGAQKLVDDAAKLQGQSVKAIQQRSAFAKIAGFDRPEDAISNILSGKRPLRGYREIARIARASGPNATGGLRRATFDVLFQRATGPNGLISGASLRQMLEAKIGNKSLMQTMGEMGVLNTTQADSITRLISRAEKFEQALASGRKIEDALDDVGALEDLFTRIIGANIGGASAVAGASGTPIIAAAAGSRAARQLSQKIPGQKARQILAEAIENPRLMARLLKKSPGPRERRQLRRQINAFLLQTAVPGEEQTQPQSP